MAQPGLVNLYGGAQDAYGVTPDLCALGKIIGRGFPLAAVAGRKQIMDHFDKPIVGSEKRLMMLGRFRATRLRQSPV